MKKLYPNSLYLVLLSILCSVQFSLAQNFNDKGFSFQGYAKNVEGAALSDENIEVQFSIYQQGQPVEFEEVHQTATDAFGVFHLVIGAVKPIDFKNLNFIGNSDYKLKVETRVLGGTYATISNALMQSVPYAQAADNGVPVGSMIIFAGPKANIPAGWLACDGTAYGMNDYPKLFAALGTAWGDGSAGTSGTSGDFNVPDMRGLFPRGVDDGANRDNNAGSRTALNTGGNTGGTTAKVGSYQADEVLPHGHGAGSLATNNAGIHDHGIGRGGIYKRYNQIPGTGFPFPGGPTFGIVGLDFVQGSPIEATPKLYEFPSASNTAHGEHSHTVTGNTANSSGAETRPKNVAVWYIIRAR